MINNGCSIEKESSELIYLNPYILLYLTINWVESCYDCVYGPLT